MLYKCSCCGALLCQSMDANSAFENLSECDLVSLAGTHLLSQNV